MPLLEVRGLSKSFGDFQALKNVSLTLDKGEVLGVLGPNGAGKTTLIHCMLGLITPAAGSVNAFGMDMSRDRSKILKRMNFASNYVSLPMTLTPMQNLMVYALMYEVDSPRRRCREVVEMFELTAMKDAPSRRLSSGQMMRLALAKAMINSPEVLLLDEPTAGLDPDIALKTRELLKRLGKERGLSVIYTSHNLPEMEEVSDRVLFLKEGEVLAVGKTAEVLKEYGASDLEDFFFKASARAGRDER